MNGAFNEIYPLFVELPFMSVFEVTAPLSDKVSITLGIHVNPQASP